MAVNLDKPHLWKSDIARSVNMYNDWFTNFAPIAFRETRVIVTQDVERTLRLTENLTNITPNILRQHPEILPTLRMSTCPPLAVDRLIGLASVSRSLVKRIEKDKKLPVRLKGVELENELQKISKIIERMADFDIFTWLNQSEAPSQADIYRAATIVADRLCGSATNPIIRNAQERRQLAAIQNWLEVRQYRKLEGQHRIRFDNMSPGTFSFRTNVPVMLETGKTINIPMDAVIKPKSSTQDDLPIFFEAKSAGDFTNVNKRRKEEAAKMSQLRNTYGSRVRFNLFLCGYFDSGYLGYEAAEGIDWVWEHRMDDFAQFGL
jgi:type II restriction enzyme